MCVCNSMLRNLLAYRKKEINNKICNKLKYLEICISVNEYCRTTESLLLLLLLINLNLIFIISIYFTTFTLIKGTIF